MEKEVSYTPITALSALNPLKRKIPYGWDLNIYRGCQHACRYCYAMHTHPNGGEEAFFGDICVKTNIAAVLEKELQAEGWRREVINIGGVTDSYQPAEASYELMPAILRLLIKYRTPAIISTKSALILRDFDLIDELSRLTYINVAETVTTMDEDIRALIEPGSASSLERFRVLREFRKTNASTGLHVMPIIPYLTDSRDNFEQMFALAKECGVDYVLPGTLYLRGRTRPYFLQFLAQHFPAVRTSYDHLYVTGGADKTYKDGLYAMVNELRDRYGLSSSYTKPMREKLAQGKAAK